MLSLASLGGPMPTPGSENLQQLLANADVVLKGEVLAVSTKGETTVEISSVLIPVKQMSAIIGVDRFYKGGGGASQTTVTFFVASDPRHSDLPFPQLAIGEYALLFLKGGTDSTPFPTPGLANSMFPRAWPETPPALAIPLPCWSWTSRQV